MPVNQDRVEVKSEWNRNTKYAAKDLCDMIVQV